MTLDDVIAAKRIVVCAGPGGVGKTTTAAAIALHAARKGRTALVCTIDPARRLASSLGLATLDHAERLVPREKLGAPSEPVKGELYAMMLDQRRAFDEVVEQFTRDPIRRERIFANTIYRQISQALSGSQEYAAMAKLYAIAKENRYDLVVLDTPPTANALDFLDAPQKVAQAVDSPALRWFTRAGSAGQRGIRMLGASGAFVLKRLARFTGSGFLEDMSRFFVEFEDLLRSFRQRAEDVFRLLRGPQVGFVLVASPDPLAIDEALFFHGRLLEAGMPFSAFVVNRAHAPLGPAPAAEAVLASMAERPDLEAFDRDARTRAAAVLLTNYRDFEGLAQGQAAQIDRLRNASVPPALCVRVPFFDDDVHDAEGLLRTARYLFPGAPAGD